MASLTDICNFALNRVGEKYIVNINEKSEEARACLYAWAICRDEVLRVHNWNCVTVRKALARDADAPVGDDYDYQYTIPNDCLMALDILDDPEATYLVEQKESDGSKVLLCNLLTVNLRYLRQEEQTGRYDSMLTTALSARLSVEIAYRLAQDNALAGRMRDAYEYELKRARSRDRREGSERSKHESSDTEWSKSGR